MFYKPSYSLNTKPRGAAKQNWAVGEQVKVGFLSLRITEKTSGGWLLINKDGSRKYSFTPHCGIVAL